MADTHVRVLLSIGFEPAAAEQTARNAKLMTRLAGVLEKAGVGADGCERALGKLLLTVATELPDKLAAAHEARLVGMIKAGELDATLKVRDAIAFVRAAAKKGGDVDEAALRKASGVGVVVGAAEVKAAVAAAVEKLGKERITADRYRSSGPIAGLVRKGLRWADSDVVNGEIAATLEAMLGPMTDEDKAPPKRRKGGKKEKKKNANANNNNNANKGNNNNKGKGGGNTALEAYKPVELSKAAFFPDVKDNLELNTPALLAAHLKATGGKVHTRFPPEPNGYLHIGHAKAMNLSFTYAKEMAGNCYLRYDDTNPEKESQEYIDSIAEMADWLGHKPWKVTYSSDVFDRLYDCAVELIKRGKAFVCHQTAAEIKATREADYERPPAERVGSPYRNRSVAENLQLFEDMRKGKFPEGHCTLRMKMDIASPNPNMWDQIAYRIRYTPHPHAGDAWCIYPSYDFTHCLVDSFENITHSLCTLEFRPRRESYHWLLTALDMYHPVVWEYARLNVTNMVLSKRKLNHLVTTGVVSGWDDPRILTLAGARRRGYTARAINNFCNSIGVTTNDNTMVSIKLLEHFVRMDLDTIGTRGFAVLDPLEVHITMPDGKPYPEGTVSAPNHPKKADMGAKDLGIGPVVYIDRADFREQDDKAFYGLAPNKHVLLRYGPTVRCTGVEKDDAGKVVRVNVVAEDAPGGKIPKGKLHWVAKHSAVEAEARLYELLFASEDPGSLGDKWLDDINANSLTVSAVLIDKALAAQCTTPLTPFQFERVGYFTVDQDSTKDKIVFNRTVTLRESTGKKKAGK